MRGTLRAGDRLLLETAAFPALKRGDVIVFRSKGQVLAHRIVDRTVRELRTRGDGNPAWDSMPVTEAELLGKVIAVERNGRRRAVAGGWIGRCRAVAVRGTARLYRLLGLPWRRIRVVRGMNRKGTPRFQTVRFVSPGGVKTKCIHHGKTAGIWSPEEKRWLARKPYDLQGLAPPG